MKKILLILAILILIFAGLALGPRLVEYDGYVLVVMENGTLQLRIFGVILTLITLFLVAWFTLWCLRAIYRLIIGSHHWLGSWSERNKEKAFTNGLLALAEGDYSQTKHYLSKIEHDDFNGLNLLAEAEAELQLGDRERAIELWKLALTYKKAEVAAKLNLIRDCLHHNQIEEAFSWLETLSDKQKNSKSVAQIWAQALTQAGRYHELVERLPKWKKVLGDDYAIWQQRASAGTFAEIASKEGAEQLKRSWAHLPRSTRKDPAQRAAYIQQLINHRMYKDAELALTEWRNAKPDPLLLPLYRQLKMPNPAGAIGQLERWLKASPNDVELLSTLGELAFNSNDLILAEKALTKAIKLKNRRQDILLLASIQEAKHDHHHALELYKMSVGSEG